MINRHLTSGRRIVFLLISQLAFVGKELWRDEDEENDEPYEDPVPHGFHLATFREQRVARMCDWLAATSNELEDARDFFNRDDDWLWCQEQDEDEDDEYFDPDSAPDPVDDSYEDDADESAWRPGCTYVAGMHVDDEDKKVAKACTPANGKEVDIDEVWVTRKTERNYGSVRSTLRHRQGDSGYRYKGDIRRHRSIIGGHHGDPDALLTSASQPILTEVIVNDEQYILGR